MATAQLFSPMIAIETINTKKLTLRCGVLNVSPGPRNGTMEMLSAAGIPLSSTSYNGLASGSGVGDALSALPAGPQVTLAYCRITVDGNPNDIRGNLALLDSTGNTVISVDAR